MACNLKVITCYYMHYMPLHAPQDADGGGLGRSGRPGRPPAAIQPRACSAKPPGGKQRPKQATPWQWSLAVTPAVRARRNRPFKALTPSPAVTLRLQGQRSTANSVKTHSEGSDGDSESVIRVGHRPPATGTGAGH
jgi:hypothetical protein